MARIVDGLVHEVHGTADNARLCRVTPPGSDLSMHLPHAGGLGDPGDHAVGVASVVHGGGFFRTAQGERASG